MKSEMAGRVLGFLWPDLSSPYVSMAPPALGSPPIMAAPSYAPYPSTVPLPPPALDPTPWWSERLLLKHLGGIALLKHYTQPAGLVH